MTAYLDTDALKAEYAPYHKMHDFQSGFDDYMAGHVQTFDLPGLGGQAYARGAEAAMRISRARDWIAQNVGAN